MAKTKPAAALIILAPKGMKPPKAVKMKATKTKPKMPSGSNQKRASGC